MVLIFFHSFLWYLVIQHLKDLPGRRSHNSTMFPAWRHNSVVTLVTTPEEVSATQSRAQKHLGWQREAGIQKGVFSSISYFFPSFYISLTKLKNTKKKVEYDFPMHLSPSYKTLQLRALLLSSIHHLLLPFPTTMGIFQGNYLLWCYFIHKYFSTHLKMIRALF